MGLHRPVAVIVVSALLTSGCHPCTRVTLPDSTPPPPNAKVFSELKAGDAIRVTMRTGTPVTFTLATAQVDGLLATDGRWWLFRDMTKLERCHDTTKAANVAKWTVIGALLALTAYCVYQLGSVLSYSGG